MDRRTEEEPACRSTLRSVLEKGLSGLGSLSMVRHTVSRDDQSSPCLVPARIYKISPSWNHDTHGGYIGVCVRRTKLTSQGWILLLLVIALISGDDDDPRSAVYARMSCIVACGNEYIKYIGLNMHDRIVVIFGLDRISKKTSRYYICSEYRFESHARESPIKFYRFARGVITVLENFSMKISTFFFISICRRKLDNQLSDEMLALEKKSNSSSNNFSLWIKTKFLIILIVTLLLKVNIVL